MKNLIFIPLLAFLLIYSCKEDESSPGSPVQIEFGNTKNMNVQSINTVITTSNQHLIGIDVNNNSTIDLNFIVKVSSSGSVGDNIYIGIHTNDEIIMNGSFIADSTFHFISTTIITDNISSKVSVTEESNLICYKLHSTDRLTGYTPLI